MSTIVKVFRYVRVLLDLVDSKYERWLLRLESHHISSARSLTDIIQSGRTKQEKRFGGRKYAQRLDRYCSQSSLTARISPHLHHDFILKPHHAALLLEPIAEGIPQKKSCDRCQRQNASLTQASDKCSPLIGRAGFPLSALAATSKLCPCRSYFPHGNSLLLAP